MPLDLILTGRGVSGDKAVAMGLVNCMAEPGEALTAARKLAALLAAFPQRCLRSDRMSAYEGWTLSLDQALRNEFGRGLPSIESDEMRAGIARFTSGTGRHGTF